MYKYITLIIIDYGFLFFAVLLLTGFIMIGYLIAKGLYQPFQIINEKSITYPFLFRDYVKQHNKSLLCIYYLFSTSAILLFLVFMTELFFIVREEAPVAIQYIVIGSAILFFLILGLAVYSMSKEKYY